MVDQGGVGEENVSNEELKSAIHPSLDELVRRAEEAAERSQPPSNSSTHTFTVGQTGGRITVRSLTRGQDLAVVPLDPHDKILVTIEF